MNYSLWNIGNKKINKLKTKIKKSRDLKTLHFLFTQHKKYLSKEKLRNKIGSKPKQLNQNKSNKSQWSILS